MRFQNREQAARSLAPSRKISWTTPARTRDTAWRRPDGRVIADALDGDVDVALVRKLRAPGQAELAIGAIDETGTVLKGSYFDIASDKVRGTRNQEPVADPAHAPTPVHPVAAADRSGGTRRHPCG